MLLPVAALGYLLGSIPFGLVLTSTAGLGDIRAIGSGNIGATNVLRTGRKGLAAATLALDAFKGAVAVLAGGALAGEAGILVAGLAAVLGHLFPVWLKFKGGKGVATGAGVLLAAAPVAGLGAVLVWAGTAFATRISSAGALAACAAAPVIGLLAGDPWPVELLVLASSGLIIARHHANIRRLLAGTEPRIGQGK
ncbi:glycerol-3-phosphate 1-O-acyltransferase PlsY [Rhodovastum atsumiense]|uniref:Glycerol-3-phosphate acyltransferase n=1 Tax=Rhodovastum atsumiense TaxID=504468 RepID=A0A5M6J2F9_9PROT|nr:glycerol-3-phosphate 1-O-acyltransferase PlsY [Rhodovastum atsumiense]KAA5614780.1 glycerol-3-phosphate 1-O-acyltransferase PlsY [Rhodovastum atsumiense]